MPYAKQQDLSMILTRAIFIIFSKLVREILSRWTSALFTRQFADREWLIWWISWITICAGMVLCLVALAWFVFKHLADTCVACFGILRRKISLTFATA